MEKIFEILLYIYTYMNGKKVGEILRENPRNSEKERRTYQSVLESFFDLVLDAGKEVGLLK